MTDSPDTKAEIQAIHTVCLSTPPHPHVIQVYDFWYHNNVEEDFSRTFIKMERCHGTLQEYLDKLKSCGAVVEPLELTEIMLHILRGLWHCHELGVCHRDLKLSNSTVPFL